MKDLTFAREEFVKYSKRVFIGITDEPDIALYVDPKLNEKEDEIRICVKGGKGSIAGSNKISVLIAVYRFFKELGCRFIRPGKDGEVIKQLRLDDANVEVSEKATSPWRCMIIEGAVSFENVYDMIDFCPKVGINRYEFQFKNSAVFFRRWFEHWKSPIKKPETFDEITIAEYADALKGEAVKRGMGIQTMGHGWTAFPFGFTSDGWGKDSTAIEEENLSCLAQIDGKRGLAHGSAFQTQICYSNPIARKKIIDYVVKYCRQYPETDTLLFATADAINTCCECENCRDTRLSDHLTVLFNELDERMTEEALPQKILFGAYLDSLWAPKTARLKNPDRFIFGIYPISHTYHDSYRLDEIPEGEPLPYETNRLKRTYDVAKNFAFFKEWKKIYPDNWVIGEYHYMWDHYLDPGYQKIARVLYEDIRKLGDLGFMGMEMYQSQRCAFPTAMGIQTFGATLWNKDIDFDELSRDYFEHAYGEGWEDVYTYMQTLSDEFDMKLKPGGRDYPAMDCVPVFERCLGLIRDFRATHDLSGEGRNALEATSWKDIEIYGNFLEKYYEAILTGLHGDEEGGKKLLDDLFYRMYEIEDEVQPRWDIYNHARLIHQWYNELLTKKKKDEQNVAASDIIVETVGDQGVQG